MQFTSTTPVVKPNHNRRPFAEGLVEPEPAPIARHKINVHGTKLAAELRSCFRTLAYTAVASREGLDYIGRHGTATGCESIDPEDIGIFNEIIGRHTRREELAEIKSRRPPAFRPTDDDVRWWAIESARLDAERNRPALSPRKFYNWEPETSRVLQAMELGIIPVEMAEAVMSRSLIGHID